MSAEDRSRWDARYGEEPRLAALAPAPALVSHAHLFPRRGRVLDVACG
ncbi:SAM-dependent methyltransferase, partial [bacterium]|nr:SAM-dependent methyltransferase [bacterium]